MKRSVDVEILAPAGTYDILKAAIYAGADAVYVGGSQFGARAFAGNFSEEELLLAIDFVHLHGKKLYLAVNTLLKNREINTLYSYLHPLYERGLDAVIVQDMGVLSFIKAQFPELSIHASTQMTITNVLSAAYLETLGIDRVVPARELCLEEIRAIAEGTQLEVECFVHGALCYGYSGQCLMSSLIGGRSGNRGQCAQPCRLPYQIDYKKGSQDMLSLKDLSTIEMIPDLLSSGITFFKIEGRMKQADYVATVVSIYKKYVERYLQFPKKHFFVEEADRQMLLQAYQRRGYTDGYYKKHNGAEMLSLFRPNQIGEGKSVQIEKALPKIKEKIKGEFILTPEEHATLKVWYQEMEISIEGDCVQRATKQPLSRERIVTQLQKTGNTPFEFEALNIVMEEPVFLPMQEINDMRRRALDSLSNSVQKFFQRTAISKLPEQKSQTPCLKALKESTVTVLVETMEQLYALNQYFYVKTVYIEDAAVLRTENLEKWRPLIQEIQQSGKQVYLAMTRIFRSQASSYYDSYFTNEVHTLFDGMLIRNLESYVYLMKKQYDKPIFTDANVYQWNQYAKDFWRTKGIEGMTAPVELNYKELLHLDICDMEYIVYGYQPAMISAGCLKQTNHNCDKKEETTYLTDRYKKTFAVKNYCNYCYNVIYNSVPLCLLEQEEEIKKLNPRSLRFEFYQENVNKMEQILTWFEHVWIEKNPGNVPLTEYTKGHFKRGVK